MSCDEHSDSADATAARRDAHLDAQAAPRDASDAASSRSDAGRADASQGDGDAGPPGTLLVGRHPLNVGELAWSPDGQTIATCELDSRWGPGQVKLWSAQTFDVIGQLGDIDRNEASAGNTGWDTCSIDFSPDGQTLVESRHKLNYLRRWDLSSRAELEPFEAGGVMSVAYSPDGRNLAAVVYADRLMGAPGVTEVQLLDARTGRRRRTLRLKQYLTAAWYDPAGRRVLVSGGENMIFSASSGRPLAKMAGGTEAWIWPQHSHGEHGEAFENSRFKAQEFTVGASSPDGSRKAYIESSDDVRQPGLRLRLDQAGSSSPRYFKIPPLGDWRGRRFAVAFAPSGELLALVVSSADGASPSGLRSEIRIWDLVRNAALDGSDLPRRRASSSRDAGPSSSSDADLPPLVADDRGFVDRRGGRGWGDRCFAHLKAGRHSAAQAACLRGLELASDKAVRGALLYNLGRIAEERGETERARRRYEESLEARPGNSSVRDRLQKLLDHTP